MKGFLISERAVITVHSRCNITYSNGKARSPQPRFAQWILLQNSGIKNSRNKENVAHTKFIDISIYTVISNICQQCQTLLLFRILL